MNLENALQISGTKDNATITLRSLASNYIQDGAKLSKDFHVLYKPEDQERRNKERVKVKKKGNEKTSRDKKKNIVTEQFIMSVIDNVRNVCYKQMKRLENYNLDTSASYNILTESDIRKRGHSIAGFPPHAHLLPKRRHSLSALFSYNTNDPKLDTKKSKHLEKKLAVEKNKTSNTQLIAFTKVCHLDIIYDKKKIVDIERCTHHHLCVLTLPLYIDMGIACIKEAALVTLNNLTALAPYIALRGNPSAFAIYASIRSLVLKNIDRQAQTVYLEATQLMHYDSDSEGDIDKSAEGNIELPKIVGLGLVSVYELIKGSVTTYPALCIRALQALLNILQGQQPEALDNEPLDIIDSLFEFLLKLATSEKGDGPTSPSPPLISVACSCLLSLVVACGSTGKYLRAIADILMTSRQLAAQTIPVPIILHILQRSTQGVLLGKTQRPFWISNGIPKTSRVQSFIVQLMSDGSGDMKCSMASNGHYLYIHSNFGLYKVGTGYGGTLKGHIYVHRSDFFPCQFGWMGFVSDQIIFRLNGTTSEFMVIDQDTLKVSAVLQCPNHSLNHGIPFSDGTNICYIVPERDDGFIVQSLDPQCTPMNIVSEIGMTLAEKCVQEFGNGSEPSIMNTGLDEDVITVASGKEFTLIRTGSGNVHYSGCGAAIGMKSTHVPNTASNGSLGAIAGDRWPDVVITKSPKIVQIAVGHDGQHGILLTEEGIPLFLGTSRFREDGDTRGRRQAKPFKPKRMPAMEKKKTFVVNAACNNGSTALVTKTGELHVFGKDAFCADSSNGIIADLRDVHVSSVALGKAHIVALTNKGQIYTFGINNKGQCGRDYVVHSKDTECKVAASMSMEAVCEDDEDELIESGDENGQMCSPGKHRWVKNKCMVCVICNECTGFGDVCFYSGKLNRAAGQVCGCGAGDSGCAECGCCRTCANEPQFDDDQQEFIRLGFQMHLNGDLPKEMIGGNHRVAHGRRQFYAQPDIVEQGAGSSTYRPKKKKTESQAGSDCDKESSKIVPLNPAKVTMPGVSRVIQIACGFHHTVCLCSNGEVYTWGSNSHGQLGTGDLQIHGVPMLIRLPPTLRVTQVAAGSNHTILLTTNGQVYTFGAYQKGQLGREPTQYDPHEGSSKGRPPWYTVPGLVPGIGPRTGRRASWIGASAERTFIKLDRSLINAHNLMSSHVIANDNYLVFLSTGKDKDGMGDEQWKSLVISRNDVNCKNFSDASQVDFSGSAVCYDPVYSVIWSLDLDSLCLNCYNLLANGTQRPPAPSDQLFRDILSPELSLPVANDYPVSRTQVALHMLSCIDVMTWAHECGFRVVDEITELHTISKVYTKEDFAVVNRFESYGGGWGYSGHSTEAIRFMCDTDILVGGFGLFGGRGEYLGKIMLYELGFDGGEQECDGELLAESEEVQYECGASQKYAMLFEEPVPLQVIAVGVSQAHKWYVAWARISGPSSDCGSCGQGIITAEDQVVFYFKSSKRSNNGTDVNGGQIPLIFYKVVSPEGYQQHKPPDPDETVPILSKKFYLSVNNDACQSLLELLSWSWHTLCGYVTDMETLSGTPLDNNIAKLNMNRLVYICCTCLRLLRVYINDIYPSSGRSERTVNEKTCLAEGIADIKTLLKLMLSDRLPLSPLHKKGKKRSDDFQIFQGMINTVLDECHKTFVSCFNIFFPTGQLKWICLCDLLLSRDEGSETGHDSDRLLSAVLASLCSPTIRLRSTCPILTDPDSELTKKPSPSDNAVLSMQAGDLFRYPILIERMTYRTESRNGVGMMWTFREVLDRLLGIICGGVRQALRAEPVVPLPCLVHNTCLFLSAVVSELATEATSTEEGLVVASKPMHTTPSRYSKVYSGRSWSSGNGSSDAICFTIDKPSILIAGVTLYNGIGNYEYLMELYEQIPGTMNDGVRTGDRWNSLESVKGSFGAEEAVGDVVEIKFKKTVAIKKGVKYAIAVCNRGGRTANGDAGVSSVKGPDGTTFNFYGCSLSANGTTVTRGQIPQILYYSGTPIESNNQSELCGISKTQARKSALTKVMAITRAATELIIMTLGVGDDHAIDVLSSSPIFTILLPLVFANIRQVAISDPRSVVSVLSFIQEILPQTAALNNLSQATMRSSHIEAFDSAHTTTTSHNYAYVESDHPYKPGTVSNYRVTFPPQVQWMTIEFDPLCATAQRDDYLQLYIPSLKPLNLDGTPMADLGTSLPLIDKKMDGPYWPILDKFQSLVGWPQKTIVIPGNHILFSLETASEYFKDVEKSFYYGFRALVVGYEWAPGPSDALKHLEKELALLGGLCSAALIKKDLVLPPIPGEDPEEDMEMVEDVSALIYQSHPELLGKGFALSHPPSIGQTLDGVIPFSCHSHERLFLRDFVTLNGTTSGGRLARWLQPDSYVDTKACQVLYSKEDLRAGWPAIITIITRDQYNDIVRASNMTVEVIAVPVSTGENTGKGKPRRFSQSGPDNMSFGGRPQPSLLTSYQPLIEDKMCYCAITMMKAYSDYSFEELRFASPNIRRPSENMLVRSNEDGTYSCTWTPGAIGWYSLNIKIDGYSVEKSHKVEVKEPPQGVVPTLPSTAKRPVHQPSHLRQFALKNSGGLRIRSYPYLQSEQIGLLPPNAVIAYVDELQNNDGSWLRLSDESIRKFCSDIHPEAWCIQYHKHYGKTYLTPVEPLKTLPDDGSKNTIRSAVSSSWSSMETSLQGIYTVFKCGASGHNIRSKPSMKAPAVGVLNLGNAIGVTHRLRNNEGTWVRLDNESIARFCFVPEGEAWSLAISRSQTLHLEGSTQSQTSALSSGVELGYDFNQAIQKPFPSSSKGPFVFGATASQEPNQSLSEEECMEEPEGNCEESEDVVHKLRSTKSKLARKSECDTPGANLRPSYTDGSVKKSLPEKRRVPLSPLTGAKDLPPELQGISIKELAKAIGESRANGNGATPPRTPPATPKRMSRSSSPRAHSPSPISLGARKNLVSSPIPIPSSGLAKAENSSGSYPLVSRLRSLYSQDDARDGGDSLCSTSIDVSSLPRDFSPTPPLISAQGTPRRQKTMTSPTFSPKIMTQSSTQTSPETVECGIGGSPCEEVPKIFAKVPRRERTHKPIRKRERQSTPPSFMEKPKMERVKEALSPSVSECLRAVFASFLWHEGIVHDAMACASYLKFHPELTKQQSLSKPLRSSPPEHRSKMTKEEKARQRHSVEVTGYTYLNVTIQNPEDFLKFEPNANIVEHSEERMGTRTSTDDEQFNVMDSPNSSKLPTVLEGKSEVKRDIPLGLRHILNLWEELASSCVRAISKQVIFPSPSIEQKRKLKPDKISKKDKRKRRDRGSNKSVNKDSGEEMLDDCKVSCELCKDNFAPNLIDQHLLNTHPGCKGPSQGTGYVCGKWKLFCVKDRLGDPCGIITRGCYNMCWNCRTKHKSLLVEKRSTSKAKRKIGVDMISPSHLVVDTHVIMRNNAMFLLDLASSASSTISNKPNAPRRNRTTMPCVSELSPESSPFPKVAFQCLHTLNCQQQHLNQLKEDLFLQQHTMPSGNIGGNGYHSSSGDSKDMQKESASYSPGHSRHGSPASEVEGGWARPFHRSVSVTISHAGQDWSTVASGQNESPYKSGVVMRKRNNSTSENSAAGVSSLLAHPSLALERLVSQLQTGNLSNGVKGVSVIVRPIMNFIFQNHDLETLAYAMRHATRKAAARTYGLQAMNWLLRSVTQPTCLHDLLWSFVGALSPDLNKGLEESKSHIKDIDNDTSVLEHPLGDVTLAGEAIHPLPQTFYQLLQTVADLMMLLPLGSPLQMMAIRCWGINFLPTDHDFLHQSHVFSNISKILSRSEEILGNNDDGASSVHENTEPTTSEVLGLDDVTSECSVKASSRPAMTASLTDGSTETFWESGEESRNKLKTINISCPDNLSFVSVFVHIDNTRDISNKVGSVIFKVGYSPNDASTILGIDVEAIFCGWIHADIPDVLNKPLLVILDIRGPDQSVRVRQVRILGLYREPCDNVTKFFSSVTLQQKACEQETLRVFKLLTGQVFGRLLKSNAHDDEDDSEIQNSADINQEAEPNNDLREHMVGILFSRSKLSHLQKQVCSHIVQAIKKEAKRTREEWETHLSNMVTIDQATALPQLETSIMSPVNQEILADSYCFEMLSMVMALSGSAVGRSHLSHQDSLLKYLLSLLHTGSARVQRQVVAIYRRMLVDISPSAFASVLGVKKLPPVDLTLLHFPSEDESEPYSYELGILDVFLSVIAKALTVQLKEKASEQKKLEEMESSQNRAGVTPVTLQTCLQKPQSNSKWWWLNGTCSSSLAETIVSLIRDMTNNKLSEAWTQSSKGAIAENILNLTKLNESSRSTARTLLSTPTVWLAFASLCVLHQDHVDTLSSRQWKALSSSQVESPPTCDNHDDGITPAIIACVDCGNMCSECDRVLHLSRRTRSHQRTVFREEQQAIKIDLHEGCGRAKLFWLLALADSVTLKAMLEMRGDHNRLRGERMASSCRFCGSPARTSSLAPIPLCQDKECQDLAESACCRTLTCGHMCGGITGEKVCLPCLEGCSTDQSLKQDGDDMCMICFSEALSAAPCIQLECGHVFHFHCCRTVLEKRWLGPRITFNFTLCPICKMDIKHKSLSELLQPILNLYADVKRKALMRLEYEGLMRSEAIVMRGSRYFNEPALFAMDRYAYYVCYRCSKAYYGGEVRCEAEGNDEFDPRELVCGACSDVARAQMCPKHGQDFLEYKCRYCCSVAVFFCFGTTHFCNACHEDFQAVTKVVTADLPQCPAGPRAKKLPGDECPLHIVHPPTGEEFALGCGICRNAQTF